MKIIIIKSFILLFACKIVELTVLEDGALTYEPSCGNSKDIKFSYDRGLEPEAANNYILFANISIPNYSRIRLQFDTDALVSFGDGSIAIRIKDLSLYFFKPRNGITFEVQGIAPGVIPDLKSLVINTKEYCTKTWMGKVDNNIDFFSESTMPNQGNRKKNLMSGGKETRVSSANDAATNPLIPDRHLFCGKRQSIHRHRKITNAASIYPGDWPWHVAIYRHDKYTCGGTLISKRFVLTAAHCTTKRGVKVSPEILRVVLAKYNLVGDDDTSQERMVDKIIVHERYNGKLSDHDISLIKLKTVVVFNEYIQPACLWHDQIAAYLPSSTISGTVVGWGFNENDTLSTALLKATMPILPDITCIRRNPTFYLKALTENTFCAGLSNGTSPCNGDSGGGFLVFVPDTPKDDSPYAEGSWFVRGVVSTTVTRSGGNICNSEENVVFIDVAKFKTWIFNIIKDDFMVV